MATTLYILKHQENSILQGVYFGFYESVKTHAQLSAAALLLGRGQNRRACEQLNLTAQTVSGQISLLEASLGVDLFQRVGRQLEMTEAGRMALPYAEQMFQLGNELENLLRSQPDEQQLLFRIGVADVVPKSIVYRLISPTMNLQESIRITCREDKLERLLAELAVPASGPGDLGQPDAAASGYQRS